MPYLKLHEQIQLIARGLHPSPLAGTKLDVAHARLILYWNGDVPDDLHEIRDSASDVGILLDIVQAPFSEDQLKIVARELATYVEGRCRAIMIEIDAEGTGLTVYASGLPAAESNPSGATPLQQDLISAIQTLRARHEMDIRVADAAPIVQA